MFFYKFFGAVFVIFSFQKNTENYKIIILLMFWEKQRRNNNFFFVRKKIIILFEQFFVEKLYLSFLINSNITWEILNILNKTSLFIQHLFLETICVHLNFNNVSLNINKLDFINHVLFILIFWSVRRLQCLFLRRLIFYVKESLC